MKDNNWIQHVNKSIEKRGTKGDCTGSKFGSSSCPKGSKKYNLAKVFRSLAKKRKEDGGENEIDSNDYTTGLTEEFERILAANSQMSVTNETIDELSKNYDILGNSIDFTKTQDENYNNMIKAKYGRQFLPAGEARVNDAVAKNLELYRDGILSSRKDNNWGNWEGNQFENGSLRENKTFYNKDFRADGWKNRNKLSLKKMEDNIAGRMFDTYNPNGEYEGFTDEKLAEIGYTPKEIEDIRAKKAFGRTYSKIDNNWIGVLNTNTTPMESDNNTMREGGTSKFIGAGEAKNLIDKYFETYKSTDLPDNYNEFLNNIKSTFGLDNETFNELIQPYKTYLDAKDLYSGRNIGSTLNSILSYNPSSASTTNNTEKVVDDIQLSTDNKNSGKNSNSAKRNQNGKSTSNSQTTPAGNPQTTTTDITDDDLNWNETKTGTPQGTQNQVTPIQFGPTNFKYRRFFGPTVDNPLRGLKSVNFGFHVPGEQPKTNLTEEQLHALQNAQNTEEEFKNTTVSYDTSGGNGTPTSELNNEGSTNASDSTGENTSTKGANTAGSENAGTSQTITGQTNTNPQTTQNNSQKNNDGESSKSLRERILGNRINNTKKKINVAEFSLAGPVRWRKFGKDEENDIAKTKEGLNWNRLAGHIGTGLDSIASILSKDNTRDKYENYAKETSADKIFTANENPQATDSTNYLGQQYGIDGSLNSYVPETGFVRNGGERKFPIFAMRMKEDGVYSVTEEQADVLRKLGFKFEIV